MEEWEAMKRIKALQFILQTDKYENYKETKIKAKFGLKKKGKSGDINKLVNLCNEKLLKGKRLWNLGNKLKNAENGNVKKKIKFNKKKKKPFEIIYC